MTELKDKLKELRHSKNWTQKELGELLYVSRSTVAKWEAGLVVPTDEYLTRLCEIFGVGREAFIPDEEQEQLNTSKNRTIFKQKKLILLMSAALVILLALAVVLTAIALNRRTPGTPEPEKIPAPVITLTGDTDTPLEYIGFGVTKPVEKDGQMVVTVVTNILTKRVLQDMTVNPAPAGGPVTLTTDFACEAVAAYYYEITDEWLYVTDGGTFDPDERRGFFGLDFATPLTVAGSAPAYTFDLPASTAEGRKILVRLEVTVCGDTFRYFALFE